MDTVKSPENEKPLTYAPGTPERADLEKKLEELKSSKADIPLIIGGAEVRTGRTAPVSLPHDRSSSLGQCHRAGTAEVNKAIYFACEARKQWGATPWRERASIFRRAADLIAGPWRSTLVAATMLEQSKSVHQADPDAACELADYYRFNPHYLEQIYAQQPPSTETENNSLEYRPLEGFVFALTPFNFTCISGNLPTAPALMGNTVLWKPSSDSVLPAYIIMKILKEAGLPDGVINLLPGPAGEIASAVFENDWFAGFHFNGSTPMFNTGWTSIVRNLHKYKQYPRVVGETGGKGFIFAHPSCDPAALKAAIIRGAFEYQGQKYSAASRLYIPRSVWGKMKDELVSEIEAIKMGPPEDLSCFMNAVINKLAYDGLRSYINQAKKSPDAKIIAGGSCDESSGYFVSPTLIETSNPFYRTMTEDVFGPVTTAYVYEDEKFAETLKICDETSPYGLTGSIFAQDKEAIRQASEALAGAAGNFYINDKPTGAVVHRQPFGGGRASGTNDKVGWHHNLLRWTQARSVKENLAPPKDYRYPCMG